MSDENTTHMITEEMCRGFLVHKVSKKDSEKHLEEFKKVVHDNLLPGQTVITDASGNDAYTVKHEEHERTRLPSVNEAVVRLSNVTRKNGNRRWSDKQVNEIISALITTSTSRQCLVKKI